MQAIFQTGDLHMCIPVLETYVLYCTYMDKNGHPPLKEREFGKTIKTVFPKITRVRHMMKGERSYFYYYLMFRGKENISWPSMQKTQLSLHSLKTEALHDSVIGGMNSSWSFISNENDKLIAICTSVNTEDTAYSIEKQVCVNNDLSWTAKIGNVDVGKKIVKIPLLLKEFDDFKKLLLQVGYLAKTAHNAPLRPSASSMHNLASMRYELKKTREREKYWRSETEYHKQMLNIAKNDNEDLIKMCKELEANGIFPEDPKMRTLWETQQRAINSADCKTTSRKRGWDWTSMRWDPAIIKVCLQLWHRSKGAYEDLVESGYLKLPSGRLLRYYKNAVDSSSGLNKERIEWMSREANSRKVSQYGRHGAIIFDEMSIQEDIQFKQSRGKFEIVGITRLSESSHRISAITEGDIKSHMATHMLQFMFLGNDGFRFPFAHFPTANLKSSQIFELFWDAVDALQMFGFYVRLSISDGAGPNRKFVLMHFKDEKDAENKFYTTISPASGKSLTFMMDPSHNFKKVRNGLEKSKGNNSGARHFVMGDNDILWDHLYAAYIYDLENNSLQTHRYLTDDHFHLTSTSKMRNHLADDVLGDEMLHLLKVYQNHLKKIKGNWTELNSSIEFLQTTSKLLQNFKHRCPYTNMSDFRFLQNKECIQWIKKWEEESEKMKHLTAKQRQRRFLADQTKFDLVSMVLGFEKFCEHMFRDFPGCGVVTARTNQDRLENFFCSARSQNGQNNNPTVLQYESGVNAILQMEPQISAKDNCSRPSFYKNGLNLVRNKKTSIV